MAPIFRPTARRLPVFPRERSTRGSRALDAIGAVRFFGVFSGVDVKVLILSSLAAGLLVLAACGGEQAGPPAGIQVPDEPNVTVAMSPTPGPPVGPSPTPVGMDTPDPDPIADIGAHIDCGTDASPHSDRCPYTNGWAILYPNTDAQCRDNRHSDPNPCACTGDRWPRQDRHQPGLGV